VNRRGERFEPYVQLGLWHHHLGRGSDPLLVTQQIDEDVYGICVTKHADYFQGDMMLWLKNNMNAIDWTGRDVLKRQVEAYEPKKR